VSNVVGPLRRARQPLWLFLGSLTVVVVGLATLALRRGSPGSRPASDVDVAAQPGVAAAGGSGATRPAWSRRGPVTPVASGRGSGQGSGQGPASGPAASRAGLHGLGRMIYAHARWFAVGWLVLVVLGFAASGGSLGGQGLFERLKAGDAPQVPGESRTGTELLNASAPNGGSVLLLLDGVDPASPVLRSLLTAAQPRLAAAPDVQGVLSPFSAPSPATAAASVATDRRAVLVTVALKPRLTKEKQKADVAVIQPVLNQLAADVTARIPGSSAKVGGVQQLVDEINGHVQTDLRIGEAVALPMSLLVMVLVFGGLLAAGLPILGAIASISGGLACLLGFSYAIDLDSSVPSVVSVLGLGLCIDYGLLLASRYREELRRLHRASPDPLGAPTPAALEDALARTLATAGRTVMFSGITVAISLSGLMFFQATILRAVGAAGVSIVLVALLVALTLVPALLALAGDRMIRPGITYRIPLLSRLARKLGDISPQEGAFSRLAARVQRRPLLVVAGCVAVLATAAAPALGLQLVSSGFSMLPTSSVQRQLFTDLAARFPSTTQAPIVVVSTADPAQVSAWAASVVSTLPGVKSVDPVVVRSTGTQRVDLLGVRLTGSSRSQGARDVVDRIRANRPTFPVWVAGESAQVTDFVGDITSRAPLAVGVVALATFVLLFLMTGSVLVPLKALVMNVVSLGASFGVLAWVFQDGHLEGVLQFQSNGGIDQTVPALALAFAFGLSMDYEVFLLSRIKELRDAGSSNDDAVRYGLQRSGRIITSAALIVVIVFAGFAAGQLLIIKEIGVALSVAVAVDATIVRMLLVPATMTLLGEWNWWAPKPLRRLHDRFGIREGEPAAEAAVPVG